MKFKGTKLSKRTVALFAAALVLLGSGGVLGTRAVPNIQSDTFDTTIATPEISVALTENGDPVADDGELYTSLDGQVQPGMKYDDKIGVKNDGSAPEYVRVIVRRYWIGPEEESKDTTLEPSLIQLSLADGWVEKAGESKETKVYYLKEQLAVNGTATLFDSLRIDDSIAEIRSTTETESTDADGNKKTVITYEYDYNGYTFYVEAEAQGVQTHNAKDAIKSVWGVDAGSVGINL